MGGFYGQFVGWGEESTAGTPVARTAFAKAHSGTVVDMAVPRVSHDVVGARSPQRYVDGNRSASGKLILPASYQGLGLLLKHALGSVVDAGSGPSYTHTFKLLDTAPPATGGAGGSKPALTIETMAALPDAGSESFIATAALISRLSLNWRAGEPLKLEFEYVAVNAPQGAKSGSPTYADLDTYLIKASQVAATLDGSAANLRAVSITLDQGLRAADAYLGSAYVRSAYAGPARSLTGTIEKFWEAKAQYDKFESGASVPLVLTATGPTNHSLVITIPKAVYTGKTPDYAHGGELPQSLPFQGLDDATDTMLKIVSTNTVATT
jgi:hypothetical protein